MSADFLPSSGIDLASRADFTIGTFGIRPSLREVVAGGRTERLEPRVMKALVALAERPGEVVSRDSLLERCWGGRIVGDDAINRCMAKLRKVGADHGAFGVEAVPRVGYRLIVTAGRAEAPAPLAAVSEMRRWFWPAVGAAVVGVAAIVVVIVWRSAPEPLSTRTPFVVTEIEPAKTDEALKAFAVMTISDINAALARYRLPTSPAGETRFEISGSVTSESARTVARLKMVAMPSSTMIWTMTFDAPATDEAILHARIASRVAAVAGMVNEMLVRPSSDFDAGTLALLIKGVDGIANNTWSSRTGPEEAVRRSPLSAVAHASYAIALAVATGYVSPDEAGEFGARASAELARALELDPQTPETIVFQVMAMDGGDWSAALKVASEGPRSESAYGKMARGAVLTGAGRVADGMIPLLDAMETLGDRPGRYHMLVHANRARGAEVSALESTRRKLLLLPSDFSLRTVLLDLVAIHGDPDEALAILDDPNRRPNYPAATFEAYRRFALWRKEEGRRTDGGAASRQAAIAAVTGATGLPAESSAPMLVRLGDLDAAFSIAQAKAEQPARLSGPFNASFLYFTETAPMRRDPRFIALADKVGLLKFWRETGAWPDFCRSEPASICAQMQGR